MGTRTGPPRLPGPDRCLWVWHWEDVDISCDDPRIAGTKWCATHTIQLACDRAEAERAASRASYNRRTFAARQVHIAGEDVTG